MLLTGRFCVTHWRPHSFWVIRYYLPTSIKWQWVQEYGRGKQKMNDKARICTECGGDTHTEALPNHRLNNIKDDIKPVEVRKIVCNHCDATGAVTVRSGMNPSTDIRDGPFAELSREGIQKLRENRGFVPVYER